jgi:hypothetical protein
VLGKATARASKFLQDKAFGTCTSVTGRITPFGVCDIFALVKNPFGPVLSKDEADGLPLALEGTPTEGGGYSGEAAGAFPGAVRPSPLAQNAPTGFSESTAAASRAGRGARKLP